MKSVRVKGGRHLFGRKKILCDETEITKENVLDILRDAIIAHTTNSGEINTLYEYYKGNQPILQRTKTIRPDINNKIVENRANEIVSFKTGYLCGEPLQLVSRGKAEVSSAISQLNDMMLLCGKSARDKELAEWMYICGVGNRMIQPNRSIILGSIAPSLAKGKAFIPVDESPFEVFTIDPRYSFVVYHSGLGEPPLFGVKYVKRQDKSFVYTVYTAEAQFNITMGEGLEDEIVEEPNPLGTIPIIEYPLNNARLGAFEIVLPILDAINRVQSNRLDGIEQFIQSIIVLYNAEIDDDAAKSLREAGLIKLKSVGDNKADLKILAEQLDQAQTQVLVDYMYQTVLNIVGMPNRNGGSSTSDTGMATIVRDGWAAAEARAKDDELMFKDSERKFLKLVLRIMRDTVGTPLTLADMEIKFTRRNYENIQGKAQVFAQLIQSGYCDIEEAFVISNLSPDPADSASKGLAWHDSVQAEVAKMQKKQDDANGGAGGAVA